MMRPGTLPMHPQAVMSRRSGPEDAASHITVSCLLRMGGVWSEAAFKNLVVVVVVLLSSVITTVCFFSLLGF